MYANGIYVRTTSSPSLLIRYVPLRDSGAVSICIAPTSSGEWQSGWYRGTHHVLSCRGPGPLLLHCGGVFHV